MDLSYSMRDDLSNIHNLIANIGNTISFSLKFYTCLVATIENITNNYTMGFGSFVDKRVAPFVDTTEERYIFVLLFNLSLF